MIIGENIAKHSKVHTGETAVFGLRIFISNTITQSYMEPMSASSGLFQANYWPRFDKGKPIRNPRD